MNKIPQLIVLQHQCALMPTYNNNKTLTLLYCFLHLSITCQTSLAPTILDRVSPRTGTQRGSQAPPHSTHSNPARDLGELAN